MLLIRIRCSSWAKGDTLNGFILILTTVCLAAKLELAAAWPTSRGRVSHMLRHQSQWWLRLNVQFPSTIISLIISSSFSLTDPRTIRDVGSISRAKSRAKSHSRHRRQS